MQNHAVILADAHEEQALNGIIGAAFGAAGQVRCKPSSYNSTNMDAEASTKVKILTQKLVQKCKY